MESQGVWPVWRRGAPPALTKTITAMAMPRSASRQRSRSALGTAWETQRDEPGAAPPSAAAGSASVELRGEGSGSDS